MTVDKCFTDRHREASRSLPEKELVNGTIHVDKSCMWFKDGNGAIFNGSVPYDRYYVDGVETSTPTINRGDSFTDAECYKEGIEGTYSMLLQCMGYYFGLGPDMSEIHNVCGSCDNDGVVSCSITTSSSVKVLNTSGDVTYFWEIAGASLVDGQGTDSILVNTVGLYSVNVDIRCTVTDKYTTTVRESTCLHRRTHNSVGDTFLVPHVALKPRPDLVPLTGDII